MLAWISLSGMAAVVVGSSAWEGTPKFHPFELESVAACRMTHGIFGRFQSTFWWKRVAFSSMNVLRSVRAGGLKAFGTQVVADFSSPIELRPNP